MNYIELINNFWVLNKERCFTPNEIAVYFTLLDICNSLGWKNPFNQSSRNLTTQCNISENTLTKSKNYLKQSGLIDFKSGDGRRQNTIYTIKGIKICDLSYDLSDDLSDDLSYQNAADNNKLINKTKLNQTKLNNFSKEKIKKENFEKSEKPPTDPQKKEKKETTGGGGENDDTEVCNGIIITDERFEEFRKAYCGTKGGFQSEFDNFKKKHKDWKRVIPLLLPALQNEQRWRQMAKENGQWLPEQAHLKTWINQRRWEQEFNFNFNNNGNSSNKSKSGSGVSDAYKADILNRLLG